MTNTYRSFIEIPGAEDIDALDLAKTFVLNGVWILAEQDGMFLSQDQVYDQTALGTYEKEGRVYLQAILSMG